MSPKRIVAMVLGAWYLSSSLAHIVGGVIAGFTSTDQYMESSIKYEPRVNEKALGDHTVMFKGYEDRLYEISTGKEITDEAIIKAQEEAFDSTKYTRKYTDEVTINVHVVANADAIKPMEKPDAYYIHRSVKPGATDSINAKVIYLDPLGDLTEVKITKQPTLGKVELVNDKLIYTANADALKGEAPINIPVDTTSSDTTSTDTMAIVNQPVPAPITNTEEVIDIIECSVCQKEKPDVCDLMRVSVTITNKDNLEPKLYKSSSDLYVLGSTFWAKTNAHINTLDFVYDPDGDPLSIEITKKPVLDNAIVKPSATLNPFVTPSKTVNIYSRVFQYIAYFCFGATVFLLLLAPILKKWMGGVK